MPVRAGLAGPWVPALLGVLFACWLYGWRAIDPSSAGWLLHGDPAQHYLGNVFFRAEPWHWPPGLIARFGETPTSVVFTDALPVLALLSKLLGLPPALQYFGLWMVGCHALAGWFGYRLLQRLGASPARAAAGALFFIAAPAMLVRAYGHESLMGQFIILAALERALAPWRWWPWLLLVAVAVLIHPYMAFMVGALGAAAGIGAVLERRLSLARMLLLGVASAAVLGGVAWMAGYFVGTGEVSAGGHGFFSANMLTWLDPMSWNLFNRQNGVPPEQGREWSRLLPPQRQATLGQYEGFAYLGAGMLLLIVVAAARSALAQHRGEGVQLNPDIPPMRWRAVAVPTTVLALLALSAWPSIGGWVMLETPLDGAFGKVLGVFRSSGRFIWPLTYLLMATALARVSSMQLGAGLLALGLLVQAADLRDKFKEFRARFRVGPPGVELPVSAPEWAQILRRCPQLELVTERLHATRWTAPALAAGLAGARIYPAPTARLSEEAQAKRRAAVEKLLATGGWRADTVYLIADPLPAGASSANVVRSLPAGMNHLRLDGHDLAVPVACMGKG